MSRKNARFRPAFWDDLLAISDWYEERQPNLGEEFRQALLSWVHRVIRNPRAYRTISGQIRRAVVGKFRHLLFFEIMGEYVVFLGVVDGRRDVAHWLKRRQKGEA